MSHIWIRCFDIIKFRNSKTQSISQKILKQVMHLHERTADTAIYILSGQLPLVADLHFKACLGHVGKCAL